MTDGSENREVKDLQAGQSFRFRGDWTTVAAIHCAEKTYLVCIPRKDYLIRSGHQRSFYSIRIFEFNDPMEQVEFIPDRWADVNHTPVTFEVVN